MKRIILAALALVLASGSPCAAYDTTAANGVVNAWSYGNVLHVGGSPYAATNGVDIGARINAAYAKLPASGGKIVVDPQSSGGCYSFSTPIVFGTSGKWVTLEGTGPAGVGSQGTCLNYTPTTSSAAITLDYAATGAPPAPQHGIRNLTLINNGCTTTGGCSSSATGIKIGTTNAGAWDATFDGVSISGFGTGYYNPNNLSVGATWINPIFVGNTTVLSICTITERFVSGTIAGNGKIFSKGSCSSGSPELYFVSTNIYTNTGNPNFDFSGFTNPGYLSLVGVHLENSSTSPAHYVAGKVNLYISGGLAEDDNSTGTGDWMFNPQGYDFFLQGMRFVFGRSYTNIFLLDGGNTRSLLSPIDGSPSQTVTAWVGGSGATQTTFMPIAATASASFMPWTFESSLTVKQALTVNDVVTGNKLRATVMPTSCSGQPTGMLWNNSGVVNVCP